MEHLRNSEFIIFQTVAFPSAANPGHKSSYETVDHDEFGEDSERMPGTKVVAISHYETVPSSKTIYYHFRRASVPVNINGNKGSVKDRLQLVVMDIVRYGVGGLNFSF